VQGDGSNVGKWGGKEDKADGKDKAGDKDKDDDGDKREVVVLSCGSCTNAYHAACVPEGAVRLSKKVVWCEKCSLRGRGSKEGRQVIEHASHPFTYRLLRERLKGRKKKPVMGVAGEKKRGKRKRDDEDGDKPKADGKKQKGGK
jgi:hypothetical protein